MNSVAGKVSQSFLQFERGYPFRCINEKGKITYFTSTKISRFLSLSNINERPSVTVLLGAGFSKCADLPLQNEFSSLLLSEEFDTEIDVTITRAIKDYLVDIFGWKEGDALPSMEDIFTNIDLSVQSNHHLGIKYTPKILRALERLAIHRIFQVLDRRFTYSNDIRKFLTSVRATNVTASCNFVVLNWDIVLEKHLTSLNRYVKIDYCCDSFDWNNVSGGLQSEGVKICKMHGSSNWVYCNNCKSLFFDVNRKISLTTKSCLLHSDLKIFDKGLTTGRFKNQLGAAFRNRKCKRCPNNEVAPHIATFSYRKSFSTHAYPSIWYNAERLLRDSDHWIFIGYSLPEADYELKHLIKTAQYSRLPNLDSKRKIDVVVHGESSRSKYEQFFGSANFELHVGGLSEFVSK